MSNWLILNCSNLIQGINLKKKILKSKISIVKFSLGNFRLLKLLDNRQLSLQILFYVFISIGVHCVKFSFIDINSSCRSYIWFWPVSLQLFSAVQIFLGWRSLLFCRMKIFSWGLLLFELFLWFVSWAQNILFLFEVIA